MPWASTELTLRLPGKKFGSLSHSKQPLDCTKLRPFVAKNDANSSNRDPDSINGWRLRRVMHDLYPRASSKRDDKLRSL